MFKGVLGFISVHLVECGGERHLIGTVMWYDEVGVEPVHFGKVSLSAQCEQQFIEDARVLLLLVGSSEHLDGLVNLIVEALHLRLQFMRLHVVRVHLQEVVDSVDHLFVLAFLHLHCSLLDYQLCVPWLTSDAFALNFNGFVVIIQVLLYKLALL